MKPLPFRISDRIDVRNLERLGRGKLSCSILVNTSSFKPWRTDLRNTSQWGLVSKELVCCTTKFSNFLVVEDMYPSFWVIGVVLCLPDSFSRDLLGEIGVILQVIVKWGVLPRCLDSIGE